MPRKPSVNYWPSRGGYGCWINGKQELLAAGPDDAATGPTFLAACKRYRELLELGNAANAKDDNPVRVVLEKYLRFLAESKVKPRTLEIRTDCLQAFLNAGLGELRVSQLTNIVVYDFCSEKRVPRFNKKAHRDCSWGDAAVRDFVNSMKAAFRWAADARLIASNPIASLQKPEPRSRSRDCVLSVEQHQAILACCNSTLRDVVVVMENTGARPCEIVGATAWAFNPDLGGLVYHTEARRRPGEYSHKTARKGKDRTILLTGEALEVVRRLVGEHPSGALFHDQRGKGWTSKGLVTAFRRLRDKAGVPGFTAYSYRHTFATRWLEHGGSIDVLAELMGNSPEIIRRHYAHLFNDKRELRARLEAFKAASSTCTPKLHVVGASA